MRRRKQILSALLTASMMSALLIGCGQSQSAEPESGAESVQEAESQKTQSQEAAGEAADAAASETAQGAETEETFPRISDEVITLTVAGVDNTVGADWNNTTMFAEYEKRLGIKLDATVYNSEQWSSKLTLMLASDEMPDFLGMVWSPMSRSDLVKYANDGYFLDFSPYLDVMPNLKAYMEEYPEYAQAITLDDGGIYGFPELIDRPNCAKLSYAFMPQKWLDNVGMERPESLDDLYNVLKAFKEQDANGNGDPDDEIPMGLASTGTSAAELRILWGFGINGTQNTYFLNADDSGKVSLWDTSENYKEFLKYMNRLYEEGLINQDAYVLETSELESLNKEGKVGFSGGWSSRCSGEYNDNEPGWYTPTGFTSEYNADKSVVLNSSVSSGYYFVANADTKYPEEMAKLVDYLFTTEGAISCGNGYEGVNFDAVEVAGIKTMSYDGYWEDICESAGDYRIRIATNNSGFSTLTTGKSTIYEVLESVDDETLFSEEVWVKGQANVLKEEAMRTEGLKIMDPFPNLYYTDDEAKERATLYTDIANYLTTAKAQFITGEMDVDTSWDAHLAKLNQMGLERLLEIEQAAYDRLK
ncbi:MAG: extracellular solute-binding protein [Lachnospiraceae bacterium]|nr:extracellular solute-binding protein [Lachnospiraceae bacterium]